MGTSTRVDALGDTLTLPGIAAQTAAGVEQSDISLTSDAVAPPISTSPARLGGACLSDDAILQYRQGELDAAQLEAVDGHIDRCARCRELVELVIADDSPDSSRHVTMFQRGFVVAQRYEIEQFVGKGGMGEVYAATDQMTGRRVALKTVLCTATDDLRAVRKLLDEVVNAQRVAHPHVFKIYDLHEHRDELRGRIPFFTMEFIDGQLLRARLKRYGVLPLTEVRTLARQLLAGLAAAHAKGVLHLDFKVDNVMLRSPGGEAVIMDFGLSRASDMQSRQRTSERLQGAGTLPYMSLEQLECRPDLGPASDVYSFGVVLYELLTGRLPFQAPSFRAILLAQLRERPAPPSRYVPVSAELDAFVLKCLARTPAERFADAAQALAALELLPCWQRTAAAARRLPPRWLGLMALLGSVLASALVLSGVLREPERVPERQERALQQQPPVPMVAVPAPTEPVEAVAEQAAPVVPPSEPRVSVVPAKRPSSAAARARSAARSSRERAGAVAADAPSAESSAVRPQQRSREEAKPRSEAAPAPAPSDWSGPPPQHVPQPRPL